MGYLNRKCRSVNMRLQLCRAMAIAALFFGAMCGGSASAASEPDGYPVLVNLFQQWREFEHPVMKNNVPDYSTSAMAARAAALPRWRKRLDAIDPKSWPIEEQNDYKLVKAEMNGLDFNLRVLRPWSRDPAFYVSIWDSRSDVPARDPDALIKGYAGVVSVMANVLPGGMGYNFFICTPGIYDREPPRTFEGGSGLWGFLKSSKSYVVKDPTFGEVGFGCKVEATDRALTVYPKDGLQKRGALRRSRNRCGSHAGTDQESQPQPGKAKAFTRGLGPIRSGKEVHHLVRRITRRELQALVRQIGAPRHRERDSQYRPAHARRTSD